VLCHRSLISEGNREDSIDGTVSHSGAEESNLITCKGQVHTSHMYVVEFSFLGTHLGLGGWVRMNCGDNSEWKDELLKEQPNRIDCQICGTTPGVDSVV